MDVQGITQVHIVIIASAEDSAVCSMRAARYTSYPRTIDMPLLRSMLHHDG